MGLNYKNGFSLIEILIVIAIVGILSSVVLFALTPSRNKAKDARIISDLHEIMSSAPSVYDPISGTYDLSKLATLTSSTIDDVINNVPNKCYFVWFSSQNGTTLEHCDRISNITTSTAIFAIYAQLSSGYYYCVDYRGNIKNAQYANSAVCQ